MSSYCSGKNMNKIMSTLKMVVRLIKTEHGNMAKEI